VAQLRRDIRKKMAKFTASGAYDRALAERNAQTAAQKKAPSLATGGSAKPDEPAWDD